MDIRYRYELDKLLDYYDLPMIACEVGSAEGHFTLQILKWDLDKLYLVDAWKHLDQSGDGNFPQSWHDNNYQTILERIKPFEDKVVVLRGLSVEMAKQIPDDSLGLAYIDACHEELAVLNDLEAYYPKVVPGGIISGHDYNSYYGVQRAVNKFCENRFTINIIPDEDYSMRGFWFRKPLNK